jgi:hypothetical protein
MDTRRIQRAWWGSTQAILRSSAILGHGSMSMRLQCAKVTSFQTVRFGISFRLEYNGAFAQWKLLSVEELPAGVASKALDRERDFPKVSPWPPGGIK